MCRQLGGRAAPALAAVVGTVVAALGPNLSATHAAGCPFPPASELSQRVDSVREENGELKSETHVRFPASEAPTRCCLFSVSLLTWRFHLRPHKTLTQYIENLMASAALQDAGAQGSAASGSGAAK